MNTTTTSVNTFTIESMSVYEEPAYEYKVTVPMIEGKNGLSYSEYLLWCEDYKINNFKFAIDYENYGGAALKFVLDHNLFIPKLHFFFIHEIDAALFAMRWL